MYVFIRPIFFHIVYVASPTNRYMYEWIACEIKCGDLQVVYCEIVFLSSINDDDNLLQMIYLIKTVSTKYTVMNICQV